MLGKIARSRIVQPQGIDPFDQQLIAQSRVLAAIYAQEVAARLDSGLTLVTKR